MCCVCFYFVALGVSLGFHFLLCVCYVNPAYGCQIEVNYVVVVMCRYGLLYVAGPEMASNFFTAAKSP